MAYKFNPFTGKLDVTGGDFLPLSGGVLTGDVTFPSTGFIMSDGSNTWRVTINTAGALVTTLITAAVPVPLQLIGLLGAYTYPE